MIPIIPETSASLADPEPAPILSGPVTAPRIARKTISGIQLEGVSFDSRTHCLKVIDQKDGPGSSFPTSMDAANSLGGLMAINGGFFTPDGNPLGLVISDAKSTGGWNAASSLGSGIYRINSSGRASISRRSSRSAVSNSQELLQSGPLLIENSSAVRGLDSGKSALRSIILTDGESRWWVGKTSSCSLADLGRALAVSSPTSWKIRYALNLDGGRSTDLFISSKVPGGPVERRGFLNRPVRNFLVLTGR